MKGSRSRGRSARSAAERLVRSEEIYEAPVVRRSGDAADSSVTVSTLQRKPRVYLTAPPTVSRVDLARFMGRWYEIARLPYFTQRRCVSDVYADYQLSDDGLIHVVNRCRHRDGTIGQAKGLARATDPPNNARLQISFRMFYGIHMFWDDYWIVGLGTDYDYALVGQPTRGRGWLLARHPNPPEASIAAWLSEFAAKGFPASAFLRTIQSGS